MINKIDLKSFESESNQEINVESLFIKLKRNILLILSIVSLATIYSIFYASSKDPIYKGEFQILVKDDKKENKATASELPGLVDSFVPIKLGVSKSKKITQKIILKSPLVLRPVYEFNKTEYLKRGDDISNLTYKKWIKRNIKLIFMNEGSDVLELTFKDKDKNLILSTLKMISENYQIYSKRDHVKSLNKELDYLKNQEIIYTKKYQESFKKYRDFVIENNLYSSNSKTPGRLTSNSYFNNFSANKPQYSDQFGLLEEYELRRTQYSTKLKPNSEYLKKLDLQISKLRESTNKPNKILLQRDKLNKERERDEMTLNNLKNQIIYSELSIAKQKDPWELILTPTVDEQKVSPNKKNIVLSFFLISIFVSCLLSLIKESLLGIIDDLDSIKSKLNANFLDVISLEDDDISMKIIDININKVLDDKIKKKFIGNIGFYYSKTNTLITNYINSNKNIKYIDIFDSNQIKDIQNLFIFIEAGKITEKQINKINKYLYLYSNKNFYWIYVENEKLF